MRKSVSPVFAFKLNLLKTGWLTLAVLFLFYNVATAQDVIRTIDETCFINWTEQEIYAAGVGKINPELPEGARKTAATEAAKKAAGRNIMEKIGALAVTGEVCLTDRFEKDPSLRGRIENVVRNLEVLKIEPQSPDEIVVKVSLPLIGAFSDILLPQKFSRGKLLQIDKPLCPCCGQPWPEGKPVPDNIHLIMPADSINYNSSQKYTGLIIDARGLHVSPALAPKILDELGNEIYGEMFANRDYAVDIGLVGYLTDPGSARIDSRVRDNPLIVKAVKNSGAQNADIVVSTQDGLLIHAAVRRFDFFQRCRVIILVE